MPLPPAPTQRASRLTHKAFDNPLDDHDSAASEAMDKPAPQQQTTSAKRPAKPVKAAPVRETAPLAAAPQAAAPVSY
jgi:PhoH-like ATPase